MAVRAGPITKPISGVSRCCGSWRILCFPVKKCNKTFFCRVLLLDTAGAPAQRGDGLKTLVIIPCYNEEENLDRVVERLHAAAPDVDYLIVNDCSTDGSAALCRARG